MGSAIVCAGQGLGGGSLVLPDSRVASKEVLHVEPAERAFLQAVEAEANLQVAPHQRALLVEML